MFPQVTDFSAECTAFGELLDRALCNDTKLFERPTQFKNWTLNDILGHLHVWNWAADTSLNNPDHFQEFMVLVMDAFQRGQVRTFERQWLKGLEGEALLDTWRTFAATMCERFAQADPRTRVKWAGPDMSVRSSITARLMETWAHTQAVYDLLGIEREHHDRVKNIVVLGINTYEWTFKNRRLAVPEPAPYVSLGTPSGQHWEFNEPSAVECIKGSATEFCQVVTQVRNVDDTALQVRGDNATSWMAIAQCFAGAPEDPPTAGSRFIAPVEG
ncbi:MAG: TIGR03084 family metal-binding protein [Gammaproteobacteria bacterium]